MTAKADAWRIADPRLTLTADHAMEVLRFQRDHLSELRTRSFAMLSVAALGVGVVKDEVLPDRQVGVLGWFVLGVLGVLFISATIVAMPRRWTFTFDLDGYEWHLTNGSTLDQMLRTIVDQARDRAASNFRRFRLIEFMYGVTAGALLTLVFLLILATIIR